MLVPANISEMRAWCLAAREAVVGGVVIVLAFVGGIVFFFFFVCFTPCKWRNFEKGRRRKRVGWWKVTFSIVLGPLVEENVFGGGWGGERQVR